jgi:hypothetical protein
VASLFIWEWFVIGMLVDTCCIGEVFSFHWAVVATPWADLVVFKFNS